MRFVKPKSTIRLDRADVPKIENVFRSDRGELRPGKRTDEGYLVVDAYIARPGIYNYRLPDGSIRRELVPKSTLHSRVSLDTLTLKPLTNGHPDPHVYPNMVTTDNVKDLSVGTTGQQVEIADDGRPRFVITVMDAEAVEAVEDGKLYLSPGYRTDLRFEPGDHPDFGKYDAIQENRRYNHLALTDTPRGGDTTCLRLDGAGIRTDAEPEDKEEDDMDLTEALMKQHPGLSRADAESIANSAPTLLEKAGKFDSLPEEIKVEGVDLEGVVEKAGKFDELPSNEDIASAGTAARIERVGLNVLAGDLKLDSAETVKLDNEGLKVAILKAAKVEVPKIDGIDEADAVKFTWATFKVGYKSPETNTHLDADDSDGVLSIPSTPSNEKLSGFSGVFSRYDSRASRLK